MLALVLTSSFTVQNQQEINQATAGSFNYLRVHRQGKNVAMTWAVASPEFVQFVVEKSYDDYNYDPSGCVASNASSTYKYTDTDVFAGIIYYRIRGFRSDGSSECSATETVRIVQKH